MKAKKAVKVLTAGIKINPNHRVVVFDERFADALRVAMYGSETGANFRGEVEDLGRLLAQYDGVPYDRNKNRLTQAVINIQPDKLYYRIARLNNE